MLGGRLTELHVSQRLLKAEGGLGQVFGFAANSQAVVTSGAACVRLDLNRLALFQSLSLFLLINSLEILMLVSCLVVLLLSVELFEPRIVVPHNVVRRNLGGSLQLTIDSVLVDLVDRVNAFVLDDVEPDYLDSILLLVDVVYRFENFTEATLTDFLDVLKLLFESS